MQTRTEGWKMKRNMAYADKELGVVIKGAHLFQRNAEEQTREAGPPLGSPCGVQEFAAVA